MSTKNNLGQLRLVRRGEGITAKSENQLRHIVNELSRRDSPLNKWSVRPALTVTGGEAYPTNIGKANVYRFVFADVDLTTDIEEGSRVLDVTSYADLAADADYYDGLVTNTAGGWPLLVADTANVVDYIPEGALIWVYVYAGRFYTQYSPGPLIHALTPVGGIPPMSSLTMGSAVCDLYVCSDAGVLSDAGTEITLYNMASSAVAGSVMVAATRNGAGLPVVVVEDCG